MTDVDSVTAVRTKHAEVSTRARLLAATLRTTIKPTLTAWSFLPQVIWPSHIVDHLAERLPAPEGTRVERVHLRTCGAEWITPADTGHAPAAAVLYLHGGALVTCSMSTHRLLVSHVAAVCGVPALNVDFRMMPRVTIEHMVADCLAGYRWLLDHGFDRIAIAGDSAGGYLAFLMALCLRDEGLPPPAALMCMSPLLDLGIERKATVHRRDGWANIPLAHRLRLAGDDVFSARTCSALARYTAAVDAAHEVTGPRVEPIDADLRGLPPTLIQMGSAEILRPDAEVMADRLAAAGVPVRLQIWQGQVHVFQAAAPLVPEAGAALRELGRFGRARLDTP